MFFHSLTFSFSHKQMLILSNIELIILLISFLVEFISLVGWLIEFSFWSLKVIKQLLVPLISILLNISARFLYFMLSLFIISSIPLIAFLCIVVNALPSIQLYSSFVNLYMFQAYSAGVSVLFDLINSSMNSENQFIAYKPQSKRCLLCLNEKLEILEDKENNLLNKKSEVIQICCHQNKDIFQTLVLKRRNPDIEIKISLHCNC